MRLRYPLVPAVLAVLLAAPAAQAWPTRTVATGGPASHRDVEGLPGGAVATLLERVLPARRGEPVERSLELWVGSRRTVVARAPHSFGPAELGVGGDDRPFVLYASIPRRAGPRQLFSWIDGRTERLSSGNGSVNVADLDAAADGSAVATWWQRRGGPVARPRVFAARRAAFEDRFAAVEDVTPAGEDQPGFPVAGALAGGGAIVVTGDHVVRASRVRAEFQPAQPLLPAGSEDRVNGLAVAVDADDRAVIAYRSVVGSPATRVVRAVVVAREDAAPRPPVTLSTEAVAGNPVAVANGGHVTVAFKEAASRTAAARVHAVVLTEGALRHGFSPRAGDPLGPLSAARAGGGARVYYRTGNVVRSVPVDARGHAGPISSVSADRGIYAVSPAEAGGRPVAVWTAEAAGGQRLRIARP